MLHCKTVHPVSRRVASDSIASLLQIVLMLAAITMAVAVRIPWIMIFGLALFFIAGTWEKQEGQRPRTSLLACWICAIGILAGFVFGSRTWFVFESYYLVIVWMMLITLFLSARKSSSPKSRDHWRILAITFGLAVHLGWLEISYQKDRFFDFHIALLGIVVLMICLRVSFRLPDSAAHFVHALILLLIALPITDALLRSSYHLSPHSEMAKRHYSYQATGQDPKSFARWWRFFLTQCYELMWDIGVPDEKGLAPFILTPGRDGKLFDSHIHINQLGFRGPEFQIEKGDAYRIVALGESTTFGVTLSDSDRSWPRVLEQLIKERLKPDRPVQVINAGVPSYNLANNIRRLRGQILPLKPDMIISYHGYNGFPWLNTNIPPVAEKEMPHYRQRPLKILADCEYRFRVLQYKRSHEHEGHQREKAFTEPLKNRYASAYQDLIRIARTNGIRLVLANYSMAVNSGSDSDVIEFYRAGFPKVRLQIQANALHSRIVRQLSETDSEVFFVDTHPQLDGCHEEFIDLVHLTQEGRQTLADTMFAGIRDLLEQDLAESPSILTMH